ADGAGGQRILGRAGPRGGQTGPVGDRHRRRWQACGPGPGGGTGAAVSGGADDRGPRLRTRRRPNCRPAALDAGLGFRAMTTTSVNSVDLWVEQEGEGDDVLFISGLADEGACWVDQ